MQGVSFDTSIAEKAGLHSAIIYQHITMSFMWGTHHLETRNDSLFWERESVESIVRFFPYLSQGEVIDAIKLLVLHGYLKDIDLKSVLFDRKPLNREDLDKLYLYIKSTDIHDLGENCVLTYIQIISDLYQNDDPEIKFYDGENMWTRRFFSEYSRIIDKLTTNQVTLAIDKLVESGFISKKCINGDKYSWYKDNLNTYDLLKSGGIK